MPLHASAQLPHYRTSDLSEFRNRRVMGHSLTESHTSCMHTCSACVHTSSASRKREVAGTDSRSGTQKNRGLITKCMRTHTHSDNFPATDSWWLCKNSLSTTRLGLRLSTVLVHYTSSVFFTDLLLQNAPSEKGDLAFLNCRNADLI